MHYVEEELISHLDAMISKVIDLEVIYIYPSQVIIPLQVCY